MLHNMQEPISPEKQYDNVGGIVHVSLGSIYIVHFTHMNRLHVHVYYTGLGM